MQLTLDAVPHSPPARSPVPGNRGIWVGIFCELTEFALMFLAYAYFRLTFPEDFHRGPGLLNTTAGVANTLVSRGLVERIPSTTDRRLVELALTPAGQRLMAELYPEFNGAEATLVAGVGAEDLEVMTRALRQVVLTAEAGEA